MIIQLKSVTKRFGDSIKQNQLFQQLIRDEIRSKVKRQVRIINDRLSPEELDRVSQDPDVILGMNFLMKRLFMT